MAIRQNVNPTLNRPEHDMQYNTYHVKNKTEMFPMLDTWPDLSYMQYNFNFSVEFQVEVSEYMNLK